MELIIKKPILIENEDSAKVQSRIIFPELNDQGWIDLWFEVNEPFGDCLVYERVDAFVVGLLPYLLARSSSENPLTVRCEAPISERLFYQLTRHFIPAKNTYVSWCDSFVIDAELDGSILDKPCAVATGVSGGVDSYYSLLSSLDNDDERHKVTHGLYCEIEANGPSDSDVQQAYRSMSKEICEMLGIVPVEMKTNLVSEIYGIIHELNVSYVFLSQALALQKLIRLYYYSATHTYDVFSFEENTGDTSVLFDMYCLSTENTTFYLTGADASRTQKTNYIAGFDAPKTHMMVCRNPTAKNGKLVNCSRCSKCTRTMVDLDIHGMLDEFSDVFDVQAYRDDPAYYWGYLFYKNNDIFVQETFDECKKLGIKFPLEYRISGLKKLVNNGFRRGNPLQYTYRP